MEVGSLMDAPPPPPPVTAPPTTPGPIPDRRAGRLPLAAKTVACLDVVFGAMMLLVVLDSDRETILVAITMSLFIPLGIGVLARSNLLRILARIAHGLLGGMLILGMVFSTLGLLGVGGQGLSASGGPMVAMVLFLMAWMLGLTAFFVCGFFVLGRKDVRAACRRRSDG